MKKIIGVLMILITLLVSCATETILPETGALNVSVTIGPLCPVEPCNLSNEAIKTTYESYSFVISNAIDKKVIIEQKLSYSGTKGNFKATNIPVGDYTLDLKPKNNLTGKGFPRTFKVEKDKTTSLEIDIDTGIR